MISQFKNFLINYLFISSQISTRSMNPTYIAPHIRHKKYNTSYRNRLYGTILKIRVKPFLTCSYIKLNMIYYQRFY